MKMTDCIQVALEPKQEQIRHKEQILTIAAQDFSSKRADILQQITRDKHTHILLGAVLKPNTAGFNPLQFRKTSAPSLATISMQQRDSYRSDLKTFKDGIRKQLLFGGTGTVCRHL